MATKKTAAQTTTRTFKLLKATKNTYRFDEVEEAGQAPIIGSLYVQRYVFNGSQPTTIKVTLEVGGA